jgi:hypothetical protein
MTGHTETVFLDFEKQTEVYKFVNCGLLTVFYSVNLWIL